MNIALANRLRVSGPAPSPVEITETRRAIDRARLMADTVALTGLIWWLFQEAMETHRRLPDPDGRYLSAGDRIVWPTVRHTPQEIWEADLQRLVDVKMSKEEAPLPRFAISDPTAVDRMLTVLSWLKYVKAKTRYQVERDKIVFLALASGKPPRLVRRYFHWNCADRTIGMTKTRVLQHISTGIRPYANC